MQDNCHCCEFSTVLEWDKIVYGRRSTLPVELDIPCAISKKKRQNFIAPETFLTEPPSLKKSFTLTKFTHTPMITAFTSHADGWVFESV